MRRFSVWVGAGLLTAGVSAALLVGAAAANAETSPSPEPGGSASSLSSGPEGTTSGVSPNAVKPATGDSGRATRPNRLQPTIATRGTAGQGNPATSANPSPARIVTDATPRARSSMGAVETLIGGVSDIVAKVGSVAVTSLQAVEAVVTGPPKLPPNSTVTVKTSTVQLSNGQAVPTNWYYPKTDDGAPPKRMVLLQHGFLAQGPMYSYTAANLAESTNSIVVTPTLSSNFFAKDGNWLGGTGMSKSVADLFAGDRTELTASAVAAGYASQYGLDPGTAQLPQQFAFAGHSLGAGLVSGAAGFVVDSDAADDLVGVILLDGVPTGDTLPVALTKLDAYAMRPGGHYVPVREIGAPLNLFNSPSTVNDDLSAARPFRFNGVVLDGGVHMDSMRGGNALIQFAAYLAAGFPQPQNPPAVDQLSATWLNQWFAGETDIGDDIEPGSTFDVPKSTAHGVVIGASRPNVLVAALQGFFPLLLSTLV